jgi:hypothetical protein
MLSDGCRLCFEVMDSLNAKLKLLNFSHFTTTHDTSIVFTLLDVALFHVAFRPVDRSLDNLSSEIRWSLDLRWQHPEKPAGV